MKIHWIYVLFGLMCFSLLGIIIAQGYWIKQLFNANEQSLDHVIRKVLQKTSKKSREIEYDNYYKNIKETIGSIKKSAQKKVDLQALVKDSSTNTAYLYTQRYFIENTYVPIFNFKDTLSLTNFLTDHHSVKIIQSDSVGLRPITTTSASLADNSFAFEHYIRIRGKHVAIEQRVKTSQIDSILKENMNIEGIKARYNFYILNKDSTVVYPLDVAQKNKFKKKTLYTVPLFFDDQDKPVHLLSIDILGKDKYLVKKIGSALALSIVFTLFIWTVFVLSILYIRRQRKLSAIKNDFLNNMTHEFKTPIATIEVAVEALKNEKIIKDPQRIKKYAYLIKQENKRMLSQIEMVLGMARLEKEQAHVDLQKQNVNDWVKQAIEAVRLIIESRNGLIIEEYYPEPLWSLIDPTHFLHAVINILDNANKYSKQSPIIHVVTNKEGVYNAISIKDQGIGMSKKTQKHIFDPFYREQKGNIHDVKGHGLGLSYVKKIIKLHKGLISIKSEKEKGSIFIIKIPNIKHESL